MAWGPTASYRHLVTADLTQPLTIEQRYGASVSAGTFTTGHVGADAIPALVTLLQPGTVVAWVVAEPLWPSFQQTMEQHACAWCTSPSSQSAVTVRRSRRW